ncbi:MAG: hypothetical protein HDQ97_12110 [Lachnospiraceae bacterium]|nr:hypothetical protein [Lachnospiraceae bacterium]
MSVKSAEKLGDLKGGEKIVNNLSMFDMMGRWFDYHYNYILLIEIKVKTAIEL